MSDSVEAAFRAYLTTLPIELAGSPLAMSTLVLAKIMDDRDTSATAHALCHKAYSDALDKLKALEPKAEEGDKVDELRDRRARKAGKAARRSNPTVG